MPVPDEIPVWFADKKPPIMCKSIREVDAALDKLPRQVDPTKDPLQVSIGVFGHEIFTGLGVDRTFVCINIEPCDDEFYLAVGNRTRGETKRFWGAGQDGYWQPKNLVPYKKARAAVRYFIK